MLPGLVDPWWEGLLTRFGTLVFGDAFVDFVRSGARGANVRAERYGRRCGHVLVARMQQGRGGSVALRHPVPLPVALVRKRWGEDGAAEQGRGREGYCVSTA